MKIQRTKNAARNIVFGFLLKIYQIAVPFVVRTIFIYTLGVEYLGLNSLFTSILQVLNMAEVGVGSAMVYSMYKPISEDDTHKICKLMNLYKKYYRIIGIVILIIGIILIPFLPKLISGEIPDDINIYIIYALNLLTTVFSYWLFAFKNSIFMAMQRNDITNKVSIVVSTVQYLSQAVVLCIFENYYFYLCLALMAQILNNIVTSKVADKYYPEYNAKGKLSKEETHIINKRIGDLVTSKIGGTVVSSSDSIVISAFLGLTALGVYNNYYYICLSVTNFITLIFYSFTAGIGNSIVVDDERTVYTGLKKLTFVTIAVTGVATCCLLGLYQPFMMLWVGEDNMLDFAVVVVICIYFYINIVNLLLNSYKDAAGIWNTDKYRTLVVALVNLILNIVLVNVIGIYGIILSTVISTLFIGFPWLLHNLFTDVFHSGCGTYLNKLGMYTVAIILSSIISSIICNFLPKGIWGLFVRASICVIIPTVIFILSFGRSEEFRESLATIKRLVFKKN